jgi:lipopolysaccharide/colanic/teichoic acid biosynthesis glycosyltransferase
MYFYIKRFLDVLVAVIVTLLLSPILLPIIIAIRFSGEGEIWYGQDRVGFKNKRFKIWKFATMLKNSPNIGTGDITMRNDARVTPVGKYLRMTKINELPQLFNVLLGDMSFVGPRPLMPVSFDYYDTHVQAKVYQSMPGITGIGSLVFRDEEHLVSTQTEFENPRDFYKQRIYPYKGQLELWYQEHHSFYTDFVILVLTAWSIVFKKNKLVYKLFKGIPPSPF